jgi:cytochrome b561
MRHLVNFGLLFSFSALAVTGVLAYLEPFSLTVTQIHILAGSVTLVLVILHLLSRIPYFKSRVSKGKQPESMRKQVLLFGAGFGFLLYAAVAGLPPSSWLIENSYEHKNRAQIVRSSNLVGFDQPEPHRKLIVRKSLDGNASGLSINLSFLKNLNPMPSIAVWAESTVGSMIETLYLEQSLAYSEIPLWEDYRTQRSHILPLWRHRYTLLSGITPSGEVDAVSGATESHRFALDPYLVAGKENEFVLCVEINAPADTNEQHKDPILGQPSLLYSCLIEIDREEPYYLLELTGHGGGDALETGNIQYDLDDIDSAKQMKDLFLVKLEK